MHTKVSPDQVLAKIKSETFTVLPSGKVMVCELTLENGFTVTGQSGVVHKDNFVREIGMEISRKNAINEIWQLEGYLLQQELYNQGNK